MSSFHLNDDVLNGMSPEMRDLLLQAQEQLADSTKNPDATAKSEENEIDDFLMNGNRTDDDFYPPGMKEKFDNDEKDFADLYAQDEKYDSGIPFSLDQDSVSPDDFAPYKSPSVRSTSRYESKPASSAIEIRAKQRQYAVEIEEFGDFLNLSHKVPSLKTLMRMPIDDLEDLWNFYDEKYHRHQKKCMMRQALAVVGALAGFGINRVYKLLLKSDMMDMTVWADHWYVRVTTVRPDKSPPYDAALMVCLRRLAWLDDVASGEGAIIMNWKKD
jgi:hypothetical protein